jgi:transcriptional regulator with XRE-family HTH domain
VASHGGAPEHYLAAPPSARRTVAVMTLGERLRAAIDRKNKSHAWVAEEVGITPGSLSAILTGKTEDPGFFTVLAIARVIEEPLSAIVDDPLTIWNADELAHLGEVGAWLLERTKRTGAGNALVIPKRRGKPRMVTAAVHPVAASPGVELYPEAFEARRQRIPAKFKKQATLVFSVIGESMTGEDIFPGDLLYVHETPDPNEAVDRIVVCTVDDMILVKRLRTRRRKIVLESANPGHKPMTVDENSSRFRLMGLVVGTSRR